MEAKTHLYMVSASTSPNQTRRFGVKFCPVSSNMATSPPPFSCTQRRSFKGYKNLHCEQVYVQGKGWNALLGVVHPKSLWCVPVSSLPQARGWQASGRGPCPRRKCIRPCLCWWLSRRRRRWSSPCLVPLGMEWPGRRGRNNHQQLHPIKTSQVCNHNWLLNCLECWR